MMQIMFNAYSTIGIPGQLKGTSVKRLLTMVERLLCSVICLVTPVCAVEIPFLPIPFSPEAGWEFYVGPQAREAGASIREQNGTLFVKSGNKRLADAFLQLIWPLEIDADDDYKLKFSADTDKAGKLSVAYVLSAPPWTKYANVSIDLVPEKKEYECVLKVRRENGYKYDTPRSLRLFLGEFAGANVAISHMSGTFSISTEKKQVKIPGLKEQVSRAQVDGIDCVWKNIAPGYANVIYDAKVDDGIITITLDGGGLSQSADGGRSWRQISHDLTGINMLQSFDISPADPKIIVSAGNYLDRTIDGGKTWSTIVDPALPPFSRVAKSQFGKVRFTCDGSRVFASLGSFGHMLTPRFGSETWMENEYHKKMVYIGDGTGANFKAFDLGSFAGIRCIYPHPTKPDVVYVSFSDGAIFVTRNAIAASPAFTKLDVPEGFEIIDIDASPWNDGELLLTMMPKGGKDGAFRVMLATDAGGSRLECKEVALKDKDGKVIRAPKIVAAKWNPRIRGQVFIGAHDADGLIVSDDDMQSFRLIPLPRELLHSEPLRPDGRSFYANPQRLYFDRKSEVAVACSAIGGWFSTDQFKTWNDLLMTFDDAKQLYGNKGVGFAECAVSIHIRKNYAYMATNDHGVFRSDGADCTKWRRISAGPGIPRRADGSLWAGLYFPMGVSEDEKFIYIVAREGWPNNPYSQKSLKLLLSTDQGESWQDVTSRFGKGDILKIDGDPLDIHINIAPDDTRYQWVLFDKQLFRSDDSGASFTEVESPVFDRKGRSLFRELAFDAAHKTLYMGNYFGFVGGSGIARSRDYGATWESVNLGVNGITFGLGVTASGSLVIGTVGKLLVVPYDKIDGGRIEDDMVKMTIGDTPEEARAAQRTFRPIVCDGEDILAFVSDGWWRTNLAHGMGPLLSRDGGKTFQWITYNLPCLEGLSAAMRDGKIIIGNRGVYYGDFQKDAREK